MQDIKWEQKGNKQQGKGNDKRKEKGNRNTTLEQRKAKVFATSNNVDNIVI